jgi:GxxExxY protein
MKVHNTLGNGYTHGEFSFIGIREYFVVKEVIYQRCLAIELNKAGILFEREKEHVIYYEGIELGTRRADFIVADTVVLEIKAVIKLEDVHLAQAKNYVVA